MKVLKIPYCSIIGIFKHNTQIRPFNPSIEVPMFKAKFLSFTLSGERQMASHESIENTVPLKWNVRTKHTQARLKLDSVKRYCEDLWLNLFHNTREKENGLRFADNA